jgi:hypothetical protein
MYFALDCLKMECYMGWGITLEGNGVGGVSWGSGSIGSGCCICCKPSVNAILQTMATTIIWDRLAIGKVDAAVLDPSMTTVNVLFGCWALVNHVAELHAKCTATGLGWCAEESIDLQNVISWLLDRNWLWNRGWRCIRLDMYYKRLRLSLIRSLKCKCQG